MVWIVEIGYKNHVTDPIGYLTKKEIEDLGIQGVKDVKSISTYMIDGEVTENDVKRICEELLSDNQIQRYKYADDKEKLRIKVDFPAWLVEINFKEGVTDAVGLSTLNAIEILGVEGVRNVNAGNKYLIIGDVPEETVKKICERVLANGLIQDYSYRKIGGN
jgi:phosphoribosylformylglycinamidine (FGAM) synthase PurS component